MKFFKAFLVILLLCAGVLLFLGVFVPEIDEEFEFKVEAPIVSVYAGIMNTDDLKVWVNGLVEVERTGGVLAMPGSTFDLHFEGKETDVVYQLEILEMVPLQSLKYRVYSDILDIEVSNHFEVDGLTTDMDIFVQVKGKGLLVKSFLPLMRSVIMDEFHQNFKGFKQLQER